MAQYVEMPDKSLAEFPDDWSPEQIEASIAEAMATRGSAPASATGASPKDAALRLPGPSYNRDWERAGYRAIPGVAAGIGALVGTPAGPAGQIGFAGLGGGGGEALSQILMRARGMGGPETPAEAWAAINKQASGMATAEALGIPIAAAGRAAGPALMRYGLRLSPKMNKEFPLVAERALADRTTSAKMADRLRASSADETARLLDVADRAGLKLSASDIAGPAIKNAQKRLGRRLTKDERNSIILMIRDRSNELLDELNPGISRLAGQPAGSAKAATFKPSEVKSLAQSAQESSRAVISAEKAGNTTRAQKNLDRLISKGAKNAKDRVRGVRASDRLTQERIGVQKAFTDAEARLSPTVPQSLAMGSTAIGSLASGHVPQAPLGLALGYAIPHPWVARRAALALTDPNISFAIQQSPLAAATLWQALTQAPPAQEER